MTVDTNVLVRALTQDDPKQSPVAERLLAEAGLVAITLPVLCEVVWVLRNSYGFSRAAIADGIRDLVYGDNVEVNLAAAEAGIAQLEAGGDFADAAIAHEGRALGADTFISFDRQAVALIGARGGKAQLLA